MPATPRKILEEVKRRIVSDPGSYSQNTFCGSCCCIAGHIDCIINGHDAHVNRPPSCAIWEIEAVALKALGESKSIWLFGQIRDDFDEDQDDDDDPDYWPMDLGEEYEEKSGVDRATVACKAIDRYMEERGI